jgi:hypothetical protein
MKIISYSILILSVLALFSCKKVDKIRVVKILSSPVTVTKVEPAYPELQDKIGPLFFETKYEKISLKCSLYAQMGEKLDLTKPADSFEIDLIKDYGKLSNPLVLKGGQEGKFFEAKFLFKSTTVRKESQFRIEEDKTVSAQFTPVITFEWRRLFYENEQDYKEKNETMNYNAELEVNERVDNMDGITTAVLNETTMTLEPKQYFEMINCSLIGVPKPQYADQYKVEAAE